MINTRSYTQEELKQLQAIELDIMKDFDEVCQKHDIKYFALFGTAIGAIRHKGFIPWDDDIDLGMLREDYEKFLKVAPAELGHKYEFNGPDCERKYYNFVPNISLKGTRFIVDLAQGKYDIGVFIDIFVYENISENEKLANRQIRKSVLLRNLYVLSNINYFKFIKGDTIVNKIKYVICGIIYAILNCIPNVSEKIYNKYLKVALQYNGKTNKYAILGDPFPKKCMADYDELFPVKKLDFEDMKINVNNKFEDMLTRHYGDFMSIPPEDKRVNHCPVEMDFGKYGV